MVCFSVLMDWWTDSTKGNDVLWFQMRTSFSNARNNATVILFSCAVNVSRIICTMIVRDIIQLHHM